MDTASPATDGGTLVERVAQVVRQRISARSLPPGARLPSIRSLAESLRVSKSTVVDAYDRLASEGSIRARAGSGFYVSGHLAPLSLAEIGPHLDRAVDPLWVSRQSLESEFELLRPGCGWLPSSWMPEANIRRALRLLARSEISTLTDYATPLGATPLRRLLAQRMAERGIQANPNQVLLTSSGTQAIDLLCRLLVEPGDTVLVDDPCYFNFLALLRAHRVKIVSAPYTPTGPDIEAFGRALAEHKPRLYITNSAIHNPTGAILSPVIAHRILKLADEHDLTILEDDIFGDFEHAPAPRLAAFDGMNRVVHVGSFSKTLSAAVRCGYIAARPDWIEKLIDLKIAASFGGERLSAELVFALLKDGSYRKHVEGLRVRLAEVTIKVCARLKAIGVTPWIEPRCGVFLWCKLPDGIDAAKVAQHALKSGIVLAPGNVFSNTQSASGFMRFNAAQSSDPKIFRALESAFEAK